VTPHEHAKRIVENYIQVGLGDPHQSTDHAVATAVAYLDLEQRLAAAEAMLREAIDDYADHSAACVLPVKWSTDRVRAKCDCGFAEWYQRAKEVLG
jgi:hypothetical protein